MRGFVGQPKQLEENRSTKTKVQVFLVGWVAPLYCSSVGAVQQSLGHRDPLRSFIMECRRLRLSLHIVLLGYRLGPCYTSTPLLYQCA